MDSLFLEQLIIYGTVFFLCGLIVSFYLWGKNKKYKRTKEKVAIAKIEGLFEPVSLHPHIDLKSCIGSGACITACPEKDILGIVDGVATVINTSNCVGHGACFHACPVEAITLRIGTESRGVDLPHVSEDYETNIKGMYIAGELGGMGLIKNSVEQGQMAVQSILKSKKPSKENILDLVIIGAGPAGISASLAAKENGLTSVTLEQDSLGGTVYTFPRSKIVMTAPMDLPLYGKVKLFDTNKDELLQLWKKVISEHQLDIREQTKVDKIVPIENDVFKIVTNTEEEFLCHQVLLSIGRRGTPRKLGIPGEESQKVAYRLLEPELIHDKKIVVVGGGDSAIESAMLLMQQNEVTLSYRNDTFSRLKPKNRDKIQDAINEGLLQVIFNSNLVSIKDKSILIKVSNEEPEEMDNDLVYIFAGGELPTKFLENAGVKISKRFGHVMKSHKK
ncbi:NAD(P)-binding domain-containing protein [Flagellimonas aequoris]|uniref:4Fe-4S dicluster domain-containing protein n=1 Tax=Flagellimonas aequoris TaxID=2306997 RepID=A0A418N8S6_9FLAO|nr:NAD(P)-binding domain-containing protein [Allomuricauda aequoris]RIV71138.1 4Fe-4S dicluster domain-containing protein [Allomuricauda aequoris]TXK02513.1 4Fe-4S dicluster domain-containing protein [Allomuricauda aequoris]